jgi:two-component system response regulator (stage 0 sporulation protein A)
MDDENLSDIDTQISETSKENIYLESIISYKLHELGVPEDMKGYDCIKEAIKILMINPEVKSRIIKLLYPELAKTFNKTSKQVEREIRKLVEATSQLESDYFKRFFYISSNCTKKVKITSSEFLCTISDNLLIKEKAYNGYII